MEDKEDVEKKENEEVKLKAQVRHLYLAIESIVAFWSGGLGRFTQASIAL